MDQTIVARLEALHRNKKIACPTCNERLIQPDGDRYEVSHDTLEGTTIIGLCHRGCGGRKPKTLFICTRCGNRSKQKAKLRRSCRCQPTNVDAPNGLSPPPLPPVEAEPSNEEAAGSNDDEPDDDHHGVSFGASQEEPPHPTHQDETHTSFDVERAIEGLFSQEGEWPKKSAKFFRREVGKKGDGLRGLVYNSLANKKSDNFSGLNDDEMHYHMHIADVHYGMPQSKSKGVCEIMAVEDKRSRSFQKRLIDELSEAYKNAISEVCGESAATTSMMEIIKGKVEQRTISFLAEDARREKINTPMEHKDLRRGYLEADNSVIKNLPIPCVSLKHGCAYVPARQIVNHLLALGKEALIYKAGCVEDWVDEDGEYECRFLEDLHHRVMELVAQGTIKRETRVITFRLWSDGFEAFQIKGNTAFNNLQLFTITLRAPRDKQTTKHTMPFALCYKKDNHYDIFHLLLEDMHELETPTKRYFGAERMFHDTVVYIQMVSNDYPERCANTCTAQLGAWTHRWGYSCKYDDKTTPSCPDCERDRITTLLEKDQRREEDQEKSNKSKCKECADWWNTDRDFVHTSAPIYPIDPENILKERSPQPAVELSFEMMIRSIKKLQEWCDSTVEDNATKKKVARAYLDRIGLASHIRDKLLKEMKEGFVFEKSVEYPRSWTAAVNNLLKLFQFPVVPMHLCTLGCEKMLISKTKMLVNRQKKDQNELWGSLTESINDTLKATEQISVDWCLSMTFSGKEHSVGTANWQSEHYLCFTRLSLFHLAPLDGCMVPKGEEGVLFMFKRMRVVWFCLIAHLFADEKVDTVTIDHLIKLFLSFCRSFWRSAPKKRKKKKEKSKRTKSKQKKGKSNQKTTKRRQPKQPSNAKHPKRGKTTGTPTQETKSNDNGRGGSRGGEEETREGGGKESRPDGNSTTKATSDEATPFFISGSNFLSLLNVPEVIRIFASMKEYWEGDHEKFIQFIKRELTTMRHTDQFLVTLLEKVLRTSTLDQLNEDNHYSQRARAIYTRTDKLRIYKASNVRELSSTHLEKDVVMAGLVDSDGNLWLCAQKTRDQPFAIYQVEFDDNEGMWTYDLWYSRATLGSETEIYEDREQLLDFASDYFLLLRLETRHTVICRSWRVRTKGGELRLPLPTKSTLLLSESQLT